MTDVLERPARVVEYDVKLKPQFIVDMGSGNTCQNDRLKVMDMIDAVAEVDSGKYEVILKWQLFESAPPNIPLSDAVFEFAYIEARRAGYKTTASVFDMYSLDYLLTFNIPFVKIACREQLYDLALSCPVPTYVSVPGEEEKSWVKAAYHLNCVPKYPATIADYEDRFADLRFVSDHTPGWELLRKYEPEIIEKHFVLERDPDNPDAGPFAVTPDELAEIL